MPSSLHSQADVPDKPLFVPPILAERQPLARNVVLLAPGASAWQRAQNTWRRIDWVAVGAGALVYAAAFATWLYLAK